MRHVIVGETPDHVHDGIGLTDVLQELVAKPFTLRRALHQPGDVDELHGRRQRALGLHDLGQLRQTGVGHFHHADVGVDRAEGIVRRFSLGRGQGVEKRRFADVGEADDAKLKHD